MSTKNLETILTLTSLVLLMVASTTSGLANCPAGCQCDDNTLIVQCGEGQLDVLPIALNPSIQRLVIKNNKIKTIDSSIQFYAELTFLDLSSNHLMNIPQRTFAYQRKLQEVHLQYNKIGAISNKTLIGLSAVTVLNLRGNLISELHQGTFAPLAKIEELNLGENRIGFIDPKAFDGLNQLRILYLDDNALTSVPDPVHFQSMPMLAELFLGTNALMTVPSAAFQDLKGLTRLNLKGAGLRNISHDSFLGLESLRILDLSDNRLTRVPTNSLSQLGRLEELFLGQNDFEAILEGAFVGLKQLKRLEITGALRLKRVMTGAFASNTNLEYLNLASNKMLNEIQEGALSGLPHLKYVNLKANGLTTLAEGLFPWQDLTTLDLSENPIACDCRVMWLRNVLINKNQTGDNVSEVLCEFPESLRGEELKNLNPALMGCSHTDPRKQALIGALLVGTAATITTLVLIVYRCRRKIRDYLKGGIFGNSALGNKEREYQKTFCDEDYMTRHQHHPCSLGIHSTFPNTYTPHNMGPAHYGPMCPVQLNGAEQKNFQQLQVPTGTILNDKKSAKTQNGAVTAEDNDSFVVHIKNSSNNAAAIQKLNHYTKPHLFQQTAAVGDSCYSYADLPIIHSSSNQEQNINYHQQPMHYGTSQDYSNSTASTVEMDPNYIYSNTHYSMPLEQGNSQRVKTPTPPPVPPALPLRNPPQMLSVSTTGRRSFNHGSKHSQSNGHAANQAQTMRYQH
ncbi:leucine-rich repeat neuronal protein 3 [Musca vetustissima]|uniref:leucine-rich repeat neuronal protein 3 n=1 Tax=Musca vetustissima TaxID=27455 RepID=UPI002AB68C9B|nr:leucine-rich repeat neuronal protein 3 [Musca vetustissima]